MFLVGLVLLVGLVGLVSLVSLVGLVGLVSLVGLVGIHFLSNKIITNRFDYAFTKIPCPCRALFQEKG